jgi:hypothetical protein
MSSTCFEPEGSSSGRQLYLQVCYNLLQEDIVKIKILVQKGAFCWFML